ncbi:MAG: hypothetical protein KBA06_00960 [Saprospiraceae bacterium]|nr:hypothetical protein [Saprospiraceae bacterium]
MKNITSYIASIILGVLVSYFLPWWSIAIVTFILAVYYKQHPLVAFGLGFASASSVWLFYAGFLSYMNAGILLPKIGELFQGLSSAQILSVTSIIAGITGGLGALIGSFLLPIIGREA